MLCAARSPTPKAKHAKALHGSQKATSAQKPLSVRSKRDIEESSSSESYRQNSLRHHRSLEWPHSFEGNRNNHQHAHTRLSKVKQRQVWPPRCRCGAPPYDEYPTKGQKLCDESANSEGDAFSRDSGQADHGYSLAHPSDWGGHYAPLTAPQHHGALKVS